MTTALALIAAVLIAVWFARRFARVLSGDGYGHNHLPYRLRDSDPFDGPQHFAA
ncbi:MAG: hypothetical protein ACRDO1_11230 [Nocardioidaceae bacterium]